MVLSPKSFNHATGFAIVCQITNLEKGYTIEIVLSKGLQIEGVILVDQVKSADWRSRNMDIKDKAPRYILFCESGGDTFVAIGWLQNR